MAHKFNPPMSLNDHGLYPVNKPKVAGGIEIGHSCVCRTEADIFERLGLVWKEPHERLGVPAVVPLPGCGIGFKWLDWPQNHDYNGFFDQAYLARYRENGGRVARGNRGAGRCFNCQETGHWAADCPKGKADAARDFLAAGSSAGPDGYHAAARTDRTL
jgi:hypothetical protein